MYPDVVYLAEIREPVKVFTKSEGMIGGKYRIVLGSGDSAVGPFLHPHV